MNQTATLPRGIADVHTLTKRMQKDAYVEVICALNHNSIYIKGQGWTCRYARGMVTHKESGLVIKSHDCHLCNGYFCLKAATLLNEQRCDNCNGPVKWSGESSCFPDLLMVNGFVETGEDAD